jgi:hypothetical protein
MKKIFMSMTIFLMLITGTSVLADTETTLGVQPANSVDCAKISGVTHEETAPILDEDGNPIKQSGSETREF